MKQFYFLAMSLLISIGLQAQIGNGIVAQTEDANIMFQPTNPDSTSVIVIQFNNTLNTTNTVNFTFSSNYLDAFSSEVEQIEISALDSVEVEFYFNPSELDYYTAQLDFSGSIFGEGTLFLYGDCVMPIISLSTQEIAFNPVPIGSSETIEIEIYNLGEGMMEIYDIFCPDTTISISETSFFVNDNNTFSLTFTPVLAGENNSIITILSNDPLNPSVNINVSTISVSEVEGSLCNGEWLPVNNPFLFTNNVKIPAGCQLEIHPGTVVDMNGYQLIVEGSLLAEGNAQDSIFFKNGNFIFRNGEDINIKYWDVDFPVQSSYTLYHNDFEDSQDYSDEELPCYGYNDNFEISGYPNNFNFNTSNNYGCDHYDISGPSNWSYSNSKYLYWRESTSGSSSSSYTYKDGVLVLKPIIVSENGNYRIMYSYKLDEHYTWNSNITSAGNLISYYKINSEEWVKFNDGPFSLHNSEHFEFPISDLINVNEGDTINVILHWDKGYYNYYAMKYLDDLKIEKVSGEDLFIYQESFEDSSYIVEHWDNQSTADDIVLNNTYATEGNNSLKFKNNSTSPYVFSQEIEIPSSGMYYIKYDKKVVKDEKYSRRFFQVYKNGSSNNMFLDYDRYDYSSSYGTTYDWKEHSAILGDFQAGDIIKLRFESYNNNYSASDGESEFYIDNIRIYNRSESSPSLIAQNSYVSVENSTIDLKINQLGEDLGVDLNNSTIRSVQTVGDNSYVNLYNSTITGSVDAGIRTSGTSAEVSLQYSFVKNNTGIGIETLGVGSHVHLNSSMISHNGSFGVKSAGQVNSNYSNITFNNDDGIYLTGNNFSNIKNSIIWGNDVVNYNQINTASGVTSITYSTVQGSGAYGTVGGQYYYGDGSIDDDPVFADADQHMSSFSNCVDAGTPWETDAHMPYGLGGVRADIGIYGGPDNWFWGGMAVPDGSPVLTSVEDSPQDQGGVAGVLFDASVWDNSSLVNNVTHYSIWRNYDVEGASIDSVEQGNWELMGNMPAQSFDAYAFEAATLGDSSVANGAFHNCYVVVAHTADSATYWYSNVYCGYSTDDIAPLSTPAFAQQTAPNEVMLSWYPPVDADYASTSVISDDGFIMNGITDTLTFDISVIEGNTYNYAVIHFDENGNPSDTAWASIQLETNRDFIPLKSGWNLISTNYTPANNTMESIFGSLMEGNLIYTTGFNSGVSIYDPNGLPFLNTLNQLDDGYGYWVKVFVDDTLMIEGSPISHDFIAPYNAGWNLAGYVAEITQPLENYYSFLLNDNNLIYATAFDEGVQVYDPNNLPFLNTLTTVDKHYGYWLKLNNPYLGNLARLSEDGQVFSPNFMVVNGKSNLSEYIGEWVEVLDEENAVVALLPIVQDGYLMTSAIYGDDPTTEDLEGVEANQWLSLRFRGEVLQDVIEFEPNMDLKKLDVMFEQNQDFMIYPNPTVKQTSVYFILEEEEKVRYELYDVTGRLLSKKQSDLLAGAHRIDIDFSLYEQGSYILNFIIGNNKLVTERIIVQ